MKSSEIIEPTFETLLLVNGTVSPAIVNTDTIFINGKKLSTDDIPLSATVTVKGNRSRSTMSVSAHLMKQGSQNFIGEELLHDDGISPDIVAGDSIYAGKVEYSILRSFVGNISVSISGSSETSASTIFFTSISITRKENNAPVIDQLNAPDTLISSSSAQTIQITMRAHDADGASDINSVFFNSYLMPDSLTSKGIVTMFDDGGASNNGSNGNTDAVAGDGIYTVTIIFPANISAQKRRFVFEAVDASNSRSNLIIHDIIIK